MKSDLTEEQEKFLKQDAFINTVINARCNEKKKNFWKLLLDTPGGVALITIVFGGIATTLITAKIDAQQKERDFRDKATQLYISKQLELNKEILTNRTKLIADASRLIGVAKNNIESFIQLDTQNFSIRQNPEFEKTLEKQRQQIRKDFNSSWENWDAIKLRMQYYFGKDLTVTSKKSTNTLDEFFICADAEKGKPLENIESRCNKERQAVNIAFDNLLPKLQDGVNLDMHEITTVIKQFREALK